MTMLVGIISRHKHTDYSDWQYTFAFLLYANFTCVLLDGRILWHMDTLVTTILTWNVLWLHVDCFYGDHTGT